jgi:hypothetical protein
MKKAASAAFFYGVSPGYSAQLRNPTKISSRSGVKKLRKCADRKRAGVANDAPRIAWRLPNQGAEYSR